MRKLAHFALERRQRQPYVCLQLIPMVLLALSCTTSASPILVPRAIVRPIPMPGFNVSVFDDTTGAPLPQTQASDGGGLINGRVFSAPNMIWAIAALVIGFPLGISGVRLWRITTALGAGLSLAFAMWTALINTISEAGLAPSQSMSDMLIIFITGAAFLVGAIGGAFRLMVAPAMAVTCVLGGASIATRGVILRPGLLVPPGLNQQLAFVNIVIVAVGALLGGLSVILRRRESMIFSTASIGSFLVALNVDLLVNGQTGMSRGLRFLFDMNDNHLADLAGGGYNPPLSSQIIVACSVAIIPILSLFQHLVFPGSFQRPRPRDRTQSRIDSSPDIKDASMVSSSSKSRSLIPPTMAPGPAWRTSVLSLFRVPGRSSNTVSSQYSADSRNAGTLPAKIANERRGSTAYNYSQGVYALPSEILRQQSRSQGLPPSRQDANTLQLNLQRLPVSVVRERPAQYAGVGLRGYSDRPANQFISTNNMPGPNLTQHATVQRTETTPLRSPNAPDGFGTRHEASTRDLRTPRTGASSGHPNTQPIPRLIGHPASTETQHTQRRPIPRIQQPPAAATLAPPSVDDVVPASASTPWTGIGLGMLRMSVDSIIDAYGETNDSGYRYGGSRTGNGGRI